MIHQASVTILQILASSEDEDAPCSAERLHVVDDGGERAVQPAGRAGKEPRVAKAQHRGVGHAAADLRHLRAQKRGRPHRLSLAAEKAVEAAVPLVSTPTLDAPRKVTAKRTKRPEVAAAAPQGKGRGEARVPTKTAMGPLQPPDNGGCAADRLRQGASDRPRKRFKFGSKEETMVPASSREGHGESVTPLRLRSKAAAASSAPKPRVVTTRRKAAGP